MPLVAAAVCPHPPLIVPEVAAGASGETDDLRAACDAAVGHLIAAEPDLLVVVGSGPRTAALAPPYRGDFRPWGAPGTTYTIGSGTLGSGPTGSGRPGAVRPLSLLVGGWLLSRHGSAPALDMVTVAADTPPSECADHGERLAGGAGRVALLAMGDGSACRGVKAPGYHDPRAEPYDEAVAAALRGADAEALLRLDRATSAELRVAGRAPWQVLAGAARATGRPWRGDLAYHCARYGVAYLVATWCAA